MRNRIALLFFFGSLALARADQTIESVQQALKDQGFYYGEITGEKNADTAAAIRRYQIRHGLQITGEINDETIRSIQNNAAASPPPAPANTPSPAPDTSGLRDDSAREPATITPAPAPPSGAVPQDRQLNSPAPNIRPLPAGGLFAGTPYETSSPELQKSVVVFAQRALARRDLYRNQIDGVFGPNLEFSLRAYQSRVGLPLTGRLDLETLAALELLPGANTPVYTPRRAVRRRPYLEPPVRGEWIHE
jgi:peptidoglycan hydrolase-like protein with peptidoglycan-binding domain